MSNQELLHACDDLSGDPLGFTQLLLTILGDGRRTATYKLAVVLALIDCCATGSDTTGHAPETISTRTIATRVVTLYWPQVRPYDVVTGILRQSSQPRARIVSAVAELRVSAESHHARTYEAAASLVPQEVELCLDRVELNLVRMPLGKLQRPIAFSETTSSYPRFLYDDSPFHEGVSRSVLPLTVHLRPHVGDWLVSLAGLLRPLVELYWIRDIARLNRMSSTEDALRDFLFRRRPRIPAACAT